MKMKNIKELVKNPMSWIALIFIVILASNYIDFQPQAFVNDGDIIFNADVDNGNTLKVVASNTQREEALAGAYAIFTKEGEFISYSTIATKYNGAQGGIRNLYQNTHALENVEDYVVVKYDLKEISHSSQETQRLIDRGISDICGASSKTQLLWNVLANPQFYVATNYALCSTVEPVIGGNYGFDTNNVCYEYGKPTDDASRCYTVQTSYNSFKDATDEDLKKFDNWQSIAVPLFKQPEPEQPSEEIPQVEEPKNNTLIYVLIGAIVLIVLIYFIKK